MTVEVLQDAARSVIASDVAIDCIATGFTFTEGALWNPRNRSLLFQRDGDRRSRVIQQANIKVE